MTRSPKAMPSSSSSSSSEEEIDSKRSRVRQKRFQKASEERRECQETLAKLQRLVPNAGEELSQLELLQRIIDYISDLQAEVNKYDSSETENKENCKPLTVPNLCSRNLTDNDRSKDLKRAPQPIS